jgi:hypothetical protein
LKVERLEAMTASLEAEVGGLRARLKRHAAAAKGFEAEVKRLKGENTGLKGENVGLKGDVARLTTEICRLRAGGVPAPAGAVVAVAPAPVGRGANAPGTLLAGRSREVASLGISWDRAGLLFAHDGGRWEVDPVRAKVAGKAPTLLLVKSKLGLYGGCAAVPRSAAGYDHVSDPAGASFVFSIEAKVERFALVNKDRAIRGCCI